MKKRLLPIGYEYRFTLIVAGLICILAQFVFLIVVINVSDLIEISVWAKVGIPTIFIGVVFFTMGLMRMKKVRVLRKERGIITEKTPVFGEIVNIKRFEMDGRGRFTSKDYANNVYVYQLVVSYVDPSDGKKKTALSEYYYENLFACLSDNQVNVYIYGDNGYVIVDGLSVRKFGEKRIAIGNQESSTFLSEISLLIDIYGGVIIPVGTVLGFIVISALVINVIPWFIKNH